MLIVPFLTVSFLSCGTPRRSNNSNRSFEWSFAETPGSLGWSTEKLNEAVTALQSAGSDAGMIVTHGKIVAQWGDITENLPAHSIRKSFMSALYGIYFKKIDLNQTLSDLGIDETNNPLTETEKSAKIIDLLKSRSGVYIAAASEIETMRAARPMRESHAPGTFWYYNNWDFNVLGQIFRQLTGEDIFQAIEQTIALPIGMEDFSAGNGRYKFEAESRFPSYPLKISVRDLARFGLLYLRMGEWRGQTVIPRQWVSDSVKSYSSAEASITKSGYGLLWWVAARSENGIKAGTFTASGTGGQRLTVLSDMDTVIVSMIDTHGSGPQMTSSGWDFHLSRIISARKR